jgi:predicted transcriptional regulator
LDLPSILGTKSRMEAIFLVLLLLSVGFTPAASTMKNFNFFRQTSDQPYPPTQPLIMPQNAKILSTNDIPQRAGPSPTIYTSGHQSDPSVRAGSESVLQFWDPTSTSTKGSESYSYVGISSASDGLQPSQTMPELLPSPEGNGPIGILSLEGHIYVVYQDNSSFGDDKFSLVPFYAPSLEVWLDSQRRRSRFRIYVETLDILKGGPLTPYEIAFHLRLNRKRTRQYIEFLLDKGFLERIDQDDKTLYSLSAAGRAFLENMKTVLGQDNPG